MEFGPGTFALGYLAGVLSTLSLCVLPLLPILVATALGQHRHGPAGIASRVDTLVCRRRAVRSP